MIVYHTSKVDVENPDVKHSRNNLDFGRGFYVTKLKQQALKYAEKFILRNQRAVLNTYDLSDDWKKAKVKIFDSYNEEWLDFIIANRKGLKVEKFDAVEGGVANDNVIDTVEDYENGRITAEQALGQLAYKKVNHQICIRAQKVIDMYLRHVESVELKGA
jgi:hypothetical protein